MIQTIKTYVEKHPATICFIIYIPVLILFRYFEIPIITTSKSVYAILLSFIFSIVMIILEHTRTDLYD